MNLRQKKKKYIGKFNNPVRRFCWLMKCSFIKFFNKLDKLGSYKTIFKSIGEKQEKLTNETYDQLEEEDDYVQHNFYGC